MAHEEYVRMVPGSDTAVLMLHGITGTPDHFEMFLHLIPETWSVHALLLEGGDLPFSILWEKLDAYIAEKQG
jgi:esterase/lipase